MKRLVSLLVIILFILTSVSANSTISADTLEIPFLEDWSSGSLDTNGWLVEGNGWLINNNVGDPFPSVEFRADLVGGDPEYTFSLTSKLISASETLAGDIFLDFYIQLININETGLEKLIVEISEDTIRNWVQVAEINNVGDINFEDGFNHVNITNQSMGKTFAIRFRAAGSNPNDIESWFIDNIHIYRNCSPPTDLEGEYFYENQNWGVEVSWNAPELPGGYNNWIYWDNGVFAGGVGTLSGGPIRIAQRWDAGQLKDWNGVDWSDLSIGKVAVLMNDNGFENMVIKIWSGPNAQTLLYEQEVENPSPGDWVEFVLDEPVDFDVDEELWVGYYVDQLGSYFPFGYDEGPAVAGYGDMISTNGITWDPISLFGIDNNLLIHASSQNGIYLHTISSFNIYRQEVNLEDDYVFYDNVGFSDEYSSYNYYDHAPEVTAGQTYNYRINAIWASEGDSCESTFALNPEETEDYVSILVTDLEELQTIELSIHPNPFFSATTISYTLHQSSTVQISIFNHLGKQVESIQQNQSSGAQQITWDASGLPSGVYYFRMQASEQMATGKLLLIK